jgi:hypothetical protein
MRAHVRSFALLVTCLGLTAGLAAAGPNDRKGPSPRPMPPGKAGPKLGLPKSDPKLTLPPSVEPKFPGVGPKPFPLPPKVEPRPFPPLPTRPTFPKIGPGTNKPPVIKPDLTPTVPPLGKGSVTRPKLPPLLIHERPKVGSPADMPRGPGLKLPGGTKINQEDFLKIKPPVDLTKVKPETILASKPPADFKVKPIKLDQIHVPGDAVKIQQLNAKNVLANQKFVVNKSFYAGGDYHTKFGVKTLGGYYCYPGIHHCHWHHCVWDPSFGCHYYYCPSASCYYYWCATAHCYYPCHWFVDYGTCYYPWWICGGFGGYGYVGTPHISIFIGW